MIILLPYFEEQPAEASPSFVLSVSPFNLEAEESF